MFALKLHPAKMKLIWRVVNRDLKFLADLENNYLKQGCTTVGAEVAYPAQPPHQTGPLTSCAARLVPVVRDS